MEKPANQQDDKEEKIAEKGYGTNLIKPAGKERKRNGWYRTSLEGWRADDRASSNTMKFSVVISTSSINSNLN